jgi:hypothetical protein
MEDRSSEETVQRQAVWRQGENAIKVQMKLLVPDLSKITKAERTEVMVFMHVWLFGIFWYFLGHIYTNSIFLSR